MIKKYRGAKIIIGKGNMGGHNALFKLNDEVHNCVLNQKSENDALIMCKFRIDHILDNKKIRSVAEQGHSVEPIRISSTSGDTKGSGGSEVNGRHVAPVPLKKKSGII